MIPPLAGWLIAAAVAAPPPTWEAAWDALLADALNGDTPAARDALHELASTELDGQSPTLPFVQYWLGRLSWKMGDSGGAREALDACIRGGSLKSACLDLRARIDLETDAVQAVPTRWTFDDARHGFLHPRGYWDQGSIRLTRADGRGVLAWRTEVDGTRDDRLVVGFRVAGAPPRRLTLAARSVTGDALLAVQLEDIDGNVYVPARRSYELPAGVDVEIVVNLADVRPATPGAPPFTGARLDRVTVLDQTSLLGVLGAHELWFDHFAVE